MESLMVVLVGSIVVFGLYYRFKTYKSMAYYRSVWWNIIIFLSIVSGSMVFGRLDMMIRIARDGVFAYYYFLPVIVVVFFAAIVTVNNYKNFFRIVNKTRFVTVGSTVLTLAFIVMIVISSDVGCFVLLVVSFVAFGFINALISPIQSAVIIASALAHLFSAGETQDLQPIFTSLLDLIDIKSAPAQMVTIIGLAVAGGGSFYSEYKELLHESLAGR